MDTAGSVRVAPRRRGRHVAALAVVASLGMVLTACGGSGKKTDRLASATSTTEDLTGTPPPAAGAAATGDPTTPVAGAVPGGTPATTAKKSGTAAKSSTA